MPADLSSAFMRALEELERAREVRPVVDLFSDEGALENPARTLTLRGKSGATQFWKDYLDAFTTIRSRFTKVLDGDRFSILEWRSDGKLPSGEAISYSGVSILEWTPGPDSMIKRFCTYYDSAAFLPEGSRHVGTMAATGQS